MRRPQSDIEDEAVRMALRRSRAPLTPPVIASRIQVLHWWHWTDWRPTCALDVIPALVRIGAVRLAGGSYRLAGHAPHRAGAGVSVRSLIHGSEAGMRHGSEGGAR